LLRNSLNYTFTDTCPVVKFGNALSKSKDIVDSAQKLLLKIMNKNAKLVGSHVNCDMDMTGFSELQFAKDIFTHAKGGTGAVMSATKVNAWRSGNGGILYNGNSNWISFLGPQGVMYLQCFPIFELIQHGFAMADIATFLETPTGRTFRANSMKVVQIKMGDCAFVPCGWLICPFVFDDSVIASADRRAGAKKVANPLEKTVSFYLSAPVLSTKVASSVPDKVWTAVNTATQEYLRAHQASDRSVAARLVAYTDFAASV
jgi:hypothetical protein